MSRPFPVVSVVGDRIVSISENMSYLSYWAVVCGVSISLYWICRKNFFDKTETPDTTDTTIWKPGLKITALTTKLGAASNLSHHRFPRVSQFDGTTEIDDFYFR